jgi:hypothetical protein
MFSALLFAISLVALAQFTGYYWRSVVAGVAAQPISPEVLSAVRLERETLSGRDFQVVAKLHELTPDLQKNGSGLGLVRAYYHAIHAMGEFASGRIKGLASWAEREQVLCVRYAAVQVDRRLQSNLALAAAIRAS